MILVYKTRARASATQIPAVNHVDDTGRLQTVEERVNPRYYRLIAEFERLTGVPIVLNTSFNENEPIVMTPEQARRHVPEDADGRARAREPRRRRARERPAAQGPLRPPPARARRRPDEPLVPDPRARPRARSSRTSTARRASRRGSSPRPARSCTRGRSRRSRTSGRASTAAGAGCCSAASSLLLPVHVAAFRRTLARARFDVVHLNDSPPSPPPLARAPRRRADRLAPALGPAAPATTGRRTRVLRYRSAGSAPPRSRSTTTSPRASASAASVIPNSVDLAPLRARATPREARGRVGLDPARPSSSFFGFIYPSKGFREFIGRRGAPARPRAPTPTT